jgi:hypothetical protein
MTAMLFARGLAFVQFMVVALGVVALHLLVKLDGTPRHSEVWAALATWLARYGLWLFAIPILWAIFATALRGKISERGINMAGVLITALLILVLGVPIVMHLR